MLAQAAVAVGEDDALLLPLLLEGMVDGFTFILRAHAGQELALGLGDAQLVEGLLDVGGHIIPALALRFHRLDVVVDVLVVDRTQIGAPGRDRLGEEDVKRLVPKLAHPVRFALHYADLVDDVMIQPFTRLESVVFGLAPSIFVIALDAFERLAIGVCSGHVSSVIAYLVDW